MAELHFFTGTMDSGKSTLALQTNHNHAARGRVGRIFTTHDRAGEATLSSRLGLTHDALEVAGRLRLLALRRRQPHPGRADRLPDLRRGPVLLPRPDRPARQGRRRAADRRLRLRHPHRLPLRALPGQPPPGRAGRPDERAPGRGALLVRQAGHPQRAHRERRDGRRGRGDRGRRRRRPRRPPRPRSPTRCSAASTTGAGSPRPGPRRSRWRPSRCPSARPVPRSVVVPIGPWPRRRDEEDRLTARTSLRGSGAPRPEGVLQ